MNKLSRKKCMYRHWCWDMSGRYYPCTQCIVKNSHINASSHSGACRHTLWKCSCPPLHTNSHHWSRLQPDKFPPTSLYGLCFFLFFFFLDGLGVIGGSSSWIHISWSWYSWAFAYSALVFSWNVPPFLGLMEHHYGLTHGDLIQLGTDIYWYTSERAERLKELNIRDVE